ncbi:hypothetical protein Nepgr_019095 [Nepenthes gracilis]|uniref:Receptor ligand binding region domain-containing protein n=1 Tax=Nepenthes gracilis TaxID=150966 RepID=A0AAD3SV96_NEPGR|nr:hypothetical protein Nepgr_019095 [Nepenthes gracilis]
MTDIAEMISYFGWAQVVANFIDDGHSRNGITVLGDELAVRRCRISYKAALPPDIIASGARMMGELHKIKMMESRVIVVHTTTYFGTLLLETTAQLDMMDSYFLDIHHLRF